MDEHDDRKIPPLVHLQTAEAARVENIAEHDAVEAASEAQTIIAHIRLLDEASFVAATHRACNSIALDRARTLMGEARTL